MRGHFATEFYKGPESGLGEPGGIAKELLCAEGTLAVVARF